MPLAGITIKATSPARHLEKLKARLAGSAVVGQVLVVSEVSIFKHPQVAMGSLPTRPGSPRFQPWRTLTKAEALDSWWSESQAGGVV